MPDDIIDSLQIDISSSSKDASKDLDALVSSLKKLDRIGKSAGLSEVKKQLKGIASIKFDNLSSQLGNIAGYIQQLEKATKALGSLTITPPIVNTEEVTKPLGDMVDEVNRASEEVREVGETFGETISTRPDWLDDMQSDCDSILDTLGTSAETINRAREQLNTALNKKKELYGTEPAFLTGTNLADTLDDKFEKLRLQSEILSEKFRSMSESDNVDLTAWDNLEKQLLSVRLQYQALEQQINKNSSAVNNLGKESNHSKNKLGKMLDRLKNVAFYRVARFLLSQIMKSATEGIQNIAKFSEKANSIMSQYKSQFTYMKNSVGSVLIPMLEAVLPLVIRIGDAFVDITNSIGMISAAMNGNDTFVKAKKYALDYSEAVEEAKKSTIGFDEINILGKQDASNDTSKMFEEVDLSGGDIAGSVAKIAALVGSITALLVIFKGAKIGEFFTKMGAGMKTAFTSLKNMSVWKKGATSIAALALEAVAVFNIFKDLTNGTTSVGNALLALVPICAIVGVAMYAMWGPVGIVIAAVVALGAAIAGVASAQIEMKREAAMAAFFATEGVALKEVTGLMNNYFQSIGLDKQQEMNEKLTEATEKLTDARLAYDSMWSTIKDANDLDTTQIEKLSVAFSDLATATNAFNSAAIESAMASLRTGIEMNITDELTDRLESLVGSLQAAQDLIGIKVSGLNSEYQQILNDVKSGKMSVSDAKPKLEELRSQMSDFTLTGNTSTVAWDMAIKEATQKGVSAGYDKESIESALTELTGERDTYLSTIKESYQSAVATMKRLIEIDQTQFGGALGFSEDDLTTLAENYNAQIEEVNRQYNAVIQSIVDELRKNAISGDYDDGWLMDVAAAFSGLFGWLGLRNPQGETGWEYLGNKKAYEEQQALLNWILEQLKNIEGEKVEIPAHAGGGFVEDGLFMANSKELVGQFSNGKTAVANNMQIVEGIKQGVAEAMSENSNQGGDWTIQIVDENGRVKGETIITAAERKNRRDGKTVISVGG